MPLTMRHILISDIINALIDITIMSVMLPWVKERCRPGTRDTSLLMKAKSQKPTEE